LPHSPHWLIPLAIGVVVLLGIGLLIARLFAGSRSAGWVRIIRLPPGDAPEQIRLAWLGLELPFVVQTGSKTVEGVLSAEPARCEGYAVLGAEAVRILSTHNPGAAEWWYRNAPHVTRDGYQLVFPADVCHPQAE